MIACKKINDSKWAMCVFHNLIPRVPVECTEGCNESSAHQLLRFLGPIPLGYEIHHGEGIPIHAHIHIRLFFYANVGRTLNVPSDLAEGLPKRGMPCR